MNFLARSDNVSSSFAYQSVGCGFEPRLHLISFDKAENIPVFSGRLFHFYPVLKASQLFVFDRNSWSEHIHSLSNFFLEFLRDVYLPDFAENVDGL